ncbi:hypothetical protein OSB04_024138 [Centaurea solstitialis]|uniref:Uncharacterized protein n=1 Tax=Centaurea solstitialis TaxID=347529 RepID=A0AA38WDK9_9ASTR|nr:hypothetical protein OSB04_024138 [Centaurea solstitialis]
MWMQTQLRDYGYTFDKIPILCDSKSVIAISANPVQHSKTKHIDIRYHFLKHHVEESNVEMYFVNWLCSRSISSVKNEEAWCNTPLKRNRKV